MYPVSPLKKRPPFYFIKNWPILIIFGSLNPEKVWHELLTDLSTSPVGCSHFTLGNPKQSLFNIIVHVYTHTRLAALFRDYPGKPVPER